MPQLIKPGDVKIVSKDGEVKLSITLDLNINLGDLGISGVSGISGSGLNNSENKSLKDSEEKVHWAIPDFTSEKINFGKGQK